MVFSSIAFLYFFLPVLLILYFAVPGKFKNTVLFTFSILFYFYGEPLYTVLLLFSSVSGYVHGRLIERFKGTAFSKVFLVSSILFGLGALGFFKYSDFFIENVNALFESDIRMLGLVLPLGISFYTFQILSYTIDVYRGDVSVQKNALDFLMYVALFPQLIAGPIVRYAQIESEIKDRIHNFENLYEGIRLFLFGLGKKVLLANTLAEVGTHFENANETSVLFHWLMAIAFTLQIYYDFSGY
ncbi:MAG: MBOAT family O-acyltransferase, partial [Bacillota bacterium]